MINHFSGCSPNYPEKPKGEAPQHIDLIDSPFGVVASCADCGAYELLPAPSPAPSGPGGLTEFGREDPAK